MDDDTPADRLLERLLDALPEPEKLSAPVAFTIGTTIFIMFVMFDRARYIFSGMDLDMSTFND